LLIKDLNLTCQTGKNSPALRPEIVDLYFNQEIEMDTTINQTPSMTEKEEDQ
jgi:hypothetical protein